jgi:uncharacterized membrane protein
MVAALISVVPIPIPATGGYTHPGAVAEVFIALAFGPWIGMVAAGVGAATSDLLLGFGSFAPLTLVAHGTLGLLVGLIAWKRSLRYQVLGWVLGGLALVGYFLGRSLVMPTHEVPVNLLQVRQSSASCSAWSRLPTRRSSSWAAK